MIRIVNGQRCMEGDGTVDVLCFVQVFAYCHKNNYRRDALMKISCVYRGIQRVVVLKVLLM